MAEFIIILQIVLAGYFLGSIPFGVVLAKIFHLPDPRYIGSGNIGATNMLRTGNKKVAALTLLLDAGKGAAAVLITYHLFKDTSPALQAYALLASALGHMYSPWLKFKGGKGVATILGAAIAFSWPLGMAFAIFWLLTVFITRMVSLGSIIALAIMPLVAWLRIDGTSALIIAAAAAIAIWKHRGNISRLRHGLEPKLSFGKGK